MKKTFKEVIKMAAFYASVGFIIQILFWNLIIASTPVAAQNLRDVKLSVNLNNVKLEKALQVIESKTNFVFSYLKDEIPYDEFVTINCTEESLYDVLCSLGKEVGLNFSRINDYITVKKTSNPSENVVSVVEVCTIKGYVTDAETKEPLQGVTITLKGTTIGTYTDKRGYYEIGNLKAGKYIITASYVGYAAITKEVILTSGKTVEANFQLGQSAMNLDEVVVTGSVTERSLKESSNPITIITPKDLANRNLTSLSTVLQTVPGIVFSGSNYMPNGGSESNVGGRLVNRVENFMSIRGYSSGEPFKIIIDGVELADPYMFNFLDPNEIERIEVARGPMSSTLYGAGSSSGIVQVFTKKGVGKLGVNFKTMFVSQESDYQEKNPFNSEYNLSINGNKGDFGYNLGIDWLHTPASRYPVTNGIDGNDWVVSTGINGKLDNLTVSASVQVNQSRAGSKDAYYSYRKMISVNNWYVSPTSPYASLASASQLMGMDLQVKGLISSLNLKHIISDNLFQNLTVGYSNQSNDMSYDYPLQLSATSIAYLVNNSFSESINAKYFMNWKQAVTEDFKVELTGGLDVVSQKATTYQGYYNDKNGENVTISVNSLGGGSLNKSTNLTTAVFAEGVWGFWEKLFLTTGLRLEKNNSYGDDLGLYSIPRVGLTYVATIGDFTFKPRASWGKSTQPISPMYKLGSTSTNSNGQVYQRLANQDLKPQSQVGYETGMDIFFTSNFSLGITYYNQKVKDMVQLVYYNDPAIYEKTQYVNISEAKNRGWEINARALFGAFTLDLAYTSIYSNYGSGFPETSTSTDPEYRDGGRIVNVPSGSFVAKLGYTIPKLLPWSQKGGSITLEYIHNGNEYALDIMTTLKNALATGVYSYVYREMPGYPIINLRSNYALFTDLNLFVDVRNLLNNQEVLYYGPLNGRNISFGFNLSVK